MSALLKDDLKLLSDNDWIVEQHGMFITKAVNQSTGCKVLGQHAAAFVFDKLEELREEHTVQLSLQERFQILEDNGYTVTCESPLEIEDPNGGLSTGECANYLLYTITKRK